MPQFLGFKLEDFKDNVAGTQWRNKGQLGGALTDSLQTLCGVTFKSVPIYRRPELYVVPEDHWRGIQEAAQGYPRCKLVVRADVQGLRFGFYVEKGFEKPDVASSPSEILDPSWDWHRFVPLVDQPGQGLSLRQLLQQHGLRLDLDYSNSQGSSFHLLASARPDGAFDVEVDGAAAIQDWSFIVDKIVQAPTDEWANVVLERFLTKEEAVAAGGAIADQITRTFCVLLPLLSSVAGLAQIQCEAEQKPINGEKEMGAHELAVYLENRFGLRFSPHQIACYVAALQTKGFVILSGMSGTGKTKLAQAFAELLQMDEDGTNYLFVPVRPDWRDNKALVGYYNPILCQYESTELLRFVLDALRVRAAPRQASPRVCRAPTGCCAPQKSSWTRAGRPDSGL